MVSCKHCHTPNSLDSTFCKRCGAAIPEEELKEAQAKLERLIEEGNTLFNQARIEEALAIADAAITSNPSSVTALSLKALCHERRGEIAEALEAADRIVELNPDSDFDRIRRSTLRQKLQSEYHLADAPDRRTALIGAVAAVVLTVCVGVYAARASTNTARSDKNLAAASQVTSGATGSVGTGFVGTGSNPATSGAQGGGIQPQGTNPEGTSPGVGQSSSTGQPPSTGGGADNRSDRVAENGDNPGRMVSPGSSRNTDPDVNPPGSGTTTGGLPLPGNDGGPIVTPVSPPSTPPTDPRPASNPSGDPGKRPDDPDLDKTPTPKSAPAEDPGFVEIKVRSGGARTPTGVPSGSTSVSGGGLETLVRVGSQDFQLGNYEGAARAYQQAIQNGGDQVILNRRLGLAYQRLGRTSEASDAYRRCIAAVDAALSAGRGNRDNLNSTRELCQQALKVLGG